MADRASIVRIERVWAEDERRFAATLRRLDPSWGTVTFDVADGVGVLCGPGLFVNRAFGVGLDAEIDHEDIALLESWSRRVGVDPSIEVTEVSRDTLIATLTERGYRSGGRASAVRRELTAADGDRRVDPSIEITSVGPDQLPVWQAVAAEAWELTDPTSRRASDVFARVGRQVDRPGLLLARDAADGRLLACSTLRTNGATATLGAMATVPSERRRGVQAAMIAHRLAVAVSLGCTEALSVAAADSTSERNLLRAGFRRSHTKVSYTRPR